MIALEMFPRRDASNRRFVRLKKIEAKALPNVLIVIVNRGNVEYKRVRGS